MSGDDLAFLSYFGILLFFIGSGVLYRGRGRLGQTLQQALIWVLIFAGVVIAYGFSDTLKAQLFPGQAARVSDQSYRLNRQPDGHFYITLKVNGTPVEFVVDTGASQIVLSQQDARRIGIDPDTLPYLGRADTANGVVKTARVVLRVITLGDIVDTDVPAQVNGGAMSGSLLGMSYLSRFRELSIRGNTLILTR